MDGVVAELEAHAEPGLSSGAKRSPRSNASSSGFSDGGFVFLGYRAYELHEDAHGQMKRGSSPRAPGLGVLSRRSPVQLFAEPVPLAELSETAT